mmetsp:Transcript_122737/g.393095  ORF Transcript_122737/g.393095 Transcript_122737/m.393095 type:complete len:210 (+) Transcript_122737:3713-4342(+)
MRAMTEQAVQRSEAMQIGSTFANRSRSQKAVSFSDLRRSFAKKPASTKLKSPRSASTWKRRSMSNRKEGIQSAWLASTVACRTPELPVAPPAGVPPTPAMASIIAAATKSTGTAGVGCLEPRKTRTPLFASSTAPATMVEGRSPAHPGNGAAHAGPTIDGRTICASRPSAAQPCKIRCSAMALVKVYVFGKPSSCIAFSAQRPWDIASR